MKTYLSIVLFVCYLPNAVSQADTINQYNSKKKKVGYWIIYLDENLKQTNSVKAVYYGFELFDDGVNLTKVSRSIKKYSVSPPTELLNKSVPKLLEGVFYLKTVDGKNELIEEYKNGYPCIFKSFETNKKISETKFESEYLDYTRKYENQSGSFYWESRSFKRNDTTRFWFRKVEGKWKDIRID